MLKVSVITAVRNAATTVDDTLRSVARQSYAKVEHVVVDGRSTDGTFEIVNSRLRAGGRTVSESDTGIYAAFNKGFGLASGDIIGYLNADDYYASDDVISEVVSTFEETGVDAVFGDAAFVSPQDLNRWVRRYRSSSFTPGLVRWGIMPAHSALFLRRGLMERCGRFDESYRIAADFELVARLFVGRGALYRHIPKVLTIMRIGGVSSSGLSSTRVISREILRACRQNGIYSNWLMVRARYLWKLREVLVP